MTDKQRTYLSQLMERTDHDEKSVMRLMGFRLRKFDSLSAEEASTLIDKLKESMEMNQDTGDDWPGEFD